jgi:hypothetical protein
MTGPIPIGAYEWVARLRDGGAIHEIENGVQRSIDCLAGLDVYELHLIPLRPDVTYTILRAGVGETVTKKWIRTITASEDGSAHEHPVIDAFTLTSAKPVHHYVFWHHDKMIQLITTSEEP